MRFSCFRVGAAMALISSTSGCAANATPGPSSPSTINVESVQPQDDPPSSVAEEEPVAPRASDVQDEECSKLAAAIPSNNANRVSVFMRVAGPVCFGSVAAADDAALENAAREAADRGVTAAVLYVDSSVVYVRVIEVMDVLRRTGIDHVSLAVGQGP